VIADERRLFAEGSFSATSTFDKHGYERRRFVYLVGVIAIALTHAAKTNEQFVEVVWHLREMVRSDMQNRWDDKSRAVGSSLTPPSLCKVIPFCKVNRRNSGKKRAFRRLYGKQGAALFDRFYDI
jgi:hypothetical protein